MNQPDEAEQARQRAECMRQMIDGIALALHKEKPTLSLALGFGELNCEVAEKIATEPALTDLIEERVRSIGNIDVRVSAVRRLIPDMHGVFHERLVGFRRYRKRHKGDFVAWTGRIGYLLMVCTEAEVPALSPVVPTR